MYTCAFRWKGLKHKFTEIIISFLRKSGMQIYTVSLQTQSQSSKPRRHNVQLATAVYTLEHNWQTNAILEHKMVLHKQLGLSFLHVPNKQVLRLMGQPFDIFCSSLPDMLRWEWSITALLNHATIRIVVLRPGTRDRWWRAWPAIMSSRRWTSTMRIWLSVHEFRRYAVWLKTTLK